MFLIYNFLSLLSLILYFPLLLFKKGPEDRRTYLKERLGISDYDDTDIWVHAVSVGEVIASLPFLKALKKDLPEKKIVLSTTTYTGQKIARDKFPEANRIMYIPWDTGFCINKAIKFLKPKIFITIETELWPVLFRKLKKARSHIVLVNGRISPESFKGYKRLKFFMKRLLSLVDFFYMQGNGDAERIVIIGAKSDKVKVMGNLKFDAEFHKPHELAEWMNRLDGHVLVAGSTHKGEEEIVLDAYESIKKNVKDLKLVLAPRHPERFNEAEKILKERKIDYIKRSQIRAQSLPAGQAGLELGIESYRPGAQGENYNTKKQELTNLPLPDVILLDTIGDLPQIFSKASVAFIGGSLLPFGGHNILEPAYWGKPIIFGPHMENFPIAKEFLKDNAALMIKNSAEAAAVIEDLLKNTEKATQMGLKAKAIISSHTGAVERAVSLVRSFFGTA
jgi:3-deoxy-D-manno-octulosonic-acid transferase